MPKTDSLLAESKKLNTEEWHRHVFALVSDPEEPLDQPLALAHALALMALGLRDVAGEYGPSFLVIAEAMIGPLKTAKGTWRQIMDTNEHEPRAIPRKTKSPVLPGLFAVLAARKTRHMAGPSLMTGVSGVPATLE